MNVKRVRLADVSTEDLVDRFAQIGVEQDQALLGGQIAKFNRLFELMSDVSNELKARTGDHRRSLVRLYEYPNMQVRLKAAKHTLAVLPIEARQQLESIAQTHWMPQAGDAGMCLELLENGTFKPS
jgi:hypothetical protein